MSYCDGPPSDIVDTARYPIHEPGTARYDAVVRFCGAALAEDGCCSLPAFLRPEAILRIAEEARRLAPRAHRSTVRHNPYFSPADLEVGPDHPRNRFQERTNGFVCTDLIGPESDLRRLYDWAGFTAFLADAFGIHPLYKYADPLASMPFNTMRPGDEFPWHFDTNEFTVTLMIQAAESGGGFEYAPNLRDPEDEHYDDVAAVMAGDRSRVRTLPLQPGDVQLFLGRYTLHRVTRVAGRRARHVALPAWARVPNMVGKAHRTRQAYGRVLPIHLAQGDTRSDSLTD